MGSLRQARARLALCLTMFSLTACDALALTPTAVRPSGPSPSSRLAPVGEIIPETAPLAPSLTPTVELAPAPTLTPTVELPSGTETPSATETPTIVPPATASPVATATLAVEPEAPAFAAIDLGFRPTPDGYQFRNYGGVNRGDYTIADMRRMFGDTAVCVSTRRGCVAKRAAIQWNNLVHSLMTAGHCDGFTVTSLRFYLSLDRHTALQARAAQTIQLRQAVSRRSIAYYWALQLPDPVSLARWENTQKTPTQVLAQLYTAMSTQPPAPTTLLVYNPDRTSGHSLTPYAIDRANAEAWRVRVYDSNWPTDLNRAVIITPTTDTWSYDLGRNIGQWAGDAGTQSLGAVPIDLYTQPPQCPWCEPVASGTGAAHALVTSEGGSQLLITDSQQRQIGLTAAGAIQELPGAYSTLIPGGLGLLDASIYYLPVTETYTLTIGSLLPTVDLALTVSPVVVRNFGPDYAVAAANLNLSGSDTSEITIRPDGRQLVYRSGANDRLTLELAAESPALSQEVELGQYLIGDGGAVTLTLDTQQRVIVDNSDNVGTSYDLTFSRAISIGEQIFTAPVVISATDTHLIDFGVWPGEGPITVTVDVGSTGAVTETLTVYPQLHRLSLPFMSQ